MSIKDQTKILTDAAQLFKTTGLWPEAVNELLVQFEHDDDKLLGFIESVETETQGDDFLSNYRKQIIKNQMGGIMLSVNEVFTSKPDMDE